MSPKDTPNAPQEQIHEILPKLGQFSDIDMIPKISSMRPNQAKLLTNSNL